MVLVLLMASVGCRHASPPAPAGPAAARTAAERDALDAELLLASDRLDAEAVERLLDAGADPNRAGGGWFEPWSEGRTDVEYDPIPSWGYTPLMAAVDAWPLQPARVYEVADRLLAAGADPGAADRAGATVLYLAIAGRATEVALRLIREGVDVETRTGPYIDSDNGTPLWKAVESGNLPVVEALLAAGADPDTRSNFGYPPLSTAIDGGHNTIAHVLIERGADVNPGAAAPAHADTEPLRGPAPLLLAFDQWLTSFDGRGLLDDLVEAGATFGDPEDPNDAFSAAFFSTLPGDAVAVLVERGVDLSGAGWDTPPLHLAAEQSWRDNTLDELLKVEGLPLDAAGPFGNALGVAYEGDHLAAAEKLLAAGIDPTGANNTSGRTLLTRAADDGRIAWLVLLLRAGADPNAPDGADTALHAAARRGDRLAVAALLAAGADPTLRDADDRTPAEVEPWKNVPEADAAAVRRALRAAAG